MINFLKSIIAGFVAMIFIHLISSYSQGTFDISRWSLTARHNTAILNLIWFFIAFIISYNFDKIKSGKYY